MTIKTIQTNFSAGVMDPKAGVREDVVFFYNGLAEGLNVVISPMGGLRRRGGMRHAHVLAPMLSALAIEPEMATAPQGGTARHA